MKNIRPIAIHLPQFHPIPENDAWWGKGFTEWRNVVQAKPRFEGHYQPHIPADLGFYDMRLPEVRQQQADLAKEYGIYGFCYYHYWFNGRQVLERPVKEILESGEPNFPFMLCWANENWTKIWDGTEKNVLLEQKYSDEDHYAHAEFLIPFFKDPRYIKVGNKPVFVVYKDAIIPNVSKMIAIFREVASKHGLELYLCRFERDVGTLPQSPIELGFDAGIEFQPLSNALINFRNIKVSPLPKFPLQKIKRLINRFFKSPSKETNLIYDYKKFVEFDSTQPRPNYKLYPGVSPGWDNTSRRKNNLAMIFKGNSPDIFKQWVQNKVTAFKPYSDEENFLFINAWNEWAEGNHLEPCLKYGHKFLSALQKGLNIS